MKIHQVLNQGNNPASTETNPDAIFLHKEQAEAHIDFLENICGMNRKEFKIVPLEEFESWHETHYEVVKAIAQTEYVKGSTACKHVANFGCGGMYDLAKELTDEFEKMHEGKQWGIDDDTVYFDAIEDFLNDKL